MHFFTVSRWKLCSVVQATIISGLLTGLSAPSPAKGAC